MKIAGVLLAAGKGARFGEAPKLMADLGGRPLVDWAAAAIEAAGIEPRAAMIRPGDSAVRAVVEARGFQVVENPRWDEGMGTSVAAGASWAAAQGVDGLLIALADVPFIHQETIARLIDELREGGERVKAVALDRGRWGPPAVIGRAHFPALQALTGDRGARDLLLDEKTVKVQCFEAGELGDIDTPELLAVAQPKARKRRG